MNKLVCFNLLFVFIPLCVISQQSAAQHARDSMQLKYTITPDSIFEDYPILHSANQQAGVYKNFQDFKCNILTPVDFEIAFSNTDSVYAIVYKNKNDRKKIRKTTWGVCDKNGNLYKHIIWNSINGFIKLERQNNHFYFYIPHTIPNMEALNSIAGNSAKGLDLSGLSFSDMGHLSLAATLLIFPAIITLEFAYTAIEIFAFVKPKDKRIARHGMGDNYRNCFINLNMGTIIY